MWPDWVPVGHTQPSDRRPCATQRPSRMARTLGARGRRRRAATVLPYAQRSLTPDRLAREFISDHLNYLPGKEEIVSNSARDVEQWFQGRVDFPVRVPQLPSAGLEDARVCQIAGRKAALLHYRHKSDDTQISLFVTVEPQNFERAGKTMDISSSYQGLNSTLWCHRGLVFSLVAAVDEASLKQMADSVRKQAP